MADVNWTTVSNGQCPCEYCQAIRGSLSVYQDAVCWANLSMKIKEQNSQICDLQDCIEHIAQLLGSDYSFMSVEERNVALIELINQATKNGNLGL